MVRRRRRVFRTFRRRGAGFWVATGLLVAIAFSVIAYIQRAQEDANVSDNTLFVFLFFNFVVAAIFGLAFLIGRNVVKLIFERRRGILGSKLRTRLVMAFVGMTLIPSVILFVVSSGLISRALEGWFSGPVKASVEGGKEIARQHYLYLRQNALKSGRELLADINTRIKAGDDSEALKIRLEKLRRKENLFQIALLVGDSSQVLEVHNAAATIESFKPPPLDKGAIQQAQAGNGEALLEDLDASKFLRTYLPIQYRGSAGVLVVTDRVSPELSHAMSLVIDSYKEFEQLNLFRSPLKSGPILTLTLLTGLILFSAIWIGFYIARQISGPVQKLAEGTAAVAKGNYNFQIRAARDDEMGLLVNSFNSMINELRESREVAERRRMTIETILENLAVGVISVDVTEKITALNPAVSRMLEISDPASSAGKHLKDILSPDLYVRLKVLIEELKSSKEPPREVSFTFSAPDGERQVVCSCGMLRNVDGTNRGSVLIFDDVTDISRAQHMLAWREVAQRIAHEIKNPLTPIQLAAQRLERLVSDGGEKGVAVRESTQAIVENVDSIKRLANEFTQFARMPELNLSERDLNTLVTEIVMPYAQSREDIVFQTVVDPKLPSVMLDSEQIRRVLINLIENATAALDSDATNSCGKRILVKTGFDSGRDMAIMEISDTGPGIPASLKARIFEPYYTTKKGGTGLGLAIVSTIIADHQGEIRVTDNRPRGTRIVIEVPIRPRIVTGRRFGDII